MKIKDGFVLREIAGEWMAVATGTRTVEFPGLIALSETAAFLWKHMEKGASLEELTKALTEEFDVNVETAEKDLNKFIAVIAEKGLFENE
ncbi:MAG: PqqD family protein [Clostridiales bacterium]|nr:PqqD family protein [Clostridiales bacterium]